MAMLMVCDGCGFGEEIQPEMVANVPHLWMRIFVGDRTRIGPPTEVTLCPSCSEPITRAALPVHDKVERIKRNESAAGMTKAASIGHSLS